jgi:nicotinate-nucleotide adenylyltransferase
MATVPVAVLARPGAKLSRALSRPRRGPSGGRSSTRGRRGGSHAREPPAWVVLNMPLNPLSSSAIRARGGWRR